MQRLNYFNHIAPLASKNRKKLRDMVLGMEFRTHFPLLQVMHQTEAFPALCRRALRSDSRVGRVQVVVKKIKLLFQLLHPIVLSDQKKTIKAVSGFLFLHGLNNPSLQPLHNCIHYRMSLSGFPVPAHLLF